MAVLAEPGGEEAGVSGERRQEAPCGPGRPTREGRAGGGRRHPGPWVHARSPRRRDPGGPRARPERLRLGARREGPGGQAPHLRPRRQSPPSNRPREKARGILRLLSRRSRRQVRLLQLTLPREPAAAANHPGASGARAPARADHGAPRPSIPPRPGVRRQRRAREGGRPPEPAAAGAAATPEKSLQLGVLESRGLLVPTPAADMHGGRQIRLDSKRANFIRKRSIATRVKG